jgi:hypothetical protein
MFLTLRCELSAKRRLTTEINNGGDHRLFITGRNQPPVNSVFDDFRQAIAGGRNDRRTASHSL